MQTNWISFILLILQNLTFASIFFCVIYLIWEKSKVTVNLFVNDQEAVILAFADYMASVSVLYSGVDVLWPAVSMNGHGCARQTGGLAVRHTGLFTSDLSPSRCSFGKKFPIFCSMSYLYSGFLSRLELIMAKQ